MHFMMMATTEEEFDGLLRLLLLLLLLAMEKQLFCSALLVVEMGVDFREDLFDWFSIEWWVPKVSAFIDIVSNQVFLLLLYLLLCQPQLLLLVVHYQQQQPLPRWSSENRSPLALLYNG